MIVMAMPITRWTIWFVGVLAIIFPILISLLMSWADFQGFYGAAYYLENLRILMWPSSLLLFSLSGLESKLGYVVSIYALAFAINILLYSVVGFFAWWGIFRDKWVLAVPAIMLTLLWGTCYLRFIA